jgi:glutathione S-transferase
MKIYDMPGIPNPVRVRIALAEKNATDQVTFIPIDIFGGEHRGSAFRALNPDATVPCLELSDGTVISQCTAITEYIDGTFEGPSLCGTTPAERAKIHMMNLRAEAGLLDAMTDYFHHATPGLGPKLETNQHPAWGKDRLTRAYATLNYFDGVLANSVYLAGDQFSMADITAYAALGFADFVKIDLPGGLNNITSWRTRVAERPSCAQ